MADSTRNPGYLSHRVELQRRQTSTDELGGMMADWVSLGPLWARVRAERLREGVTSDHLAATITYEVLIRFRDDIHQGMRFLFADHVLRVKTCADMAGDKRFLICMCEAEK